MGVWFDRVLIEDDYEMCILVVRIM